MKISFKNDYSEGCHPRILEALTELNFEQQSGYGLDEYSKNAAQLIRNKINDKILALPLRFFSFFKTI